MIRRTIAALLAVLLSGVPAVAATTYYAAPTGLSSNPGTEADPFRPQDAWAVLQAGDTLVLKGTDQTTNGRYTGGAFMLQPTPGLRGDSSNPITIRAQNDGGVSIDGQGARQPVKLTNNDWLILEGFNAHNSSETVITTDGASTDNIIRRVIAWDAAVADSSHVIRISGQRNLLEDVGTFGIGSSMIRFGGDSFGTTTTNTCRRCWGRHEGQTNTFNTHETFYVAYPGGIDSLFENSIATWSGEQLAAPQKTDLITIANWQAGTTRLFGSIAYLKCSASHAPLSLIDDQGGQDGHITAQDVIAVIENSCWTSVQGIFFRNANAAVTKTSTRVSSWGGGTPLIGSEWTSTNFNHSSTFPGTNPNPYTGANAANVCLRYVGAVLTGAKLWPWPMDDRIKAALAYASRSALSGSAGSHWAANTVTSEIETLLGAIPGACKPGGAGVGGDNTNPWRRGQSRH